MAESTPTQSSSAAAVHIVYTEKPQDEEPEAYHIRTLASVLGRFLSLYISPYVHIYIYV